jgi:prepilin-type N-terminal cleavage/methylation domain-containing protein
MSVKWISMATRKIRASWGGGEGRRGFTIVELMLVIVLSSIILAGMVALISSVFTVFRTSKDLQSLNDSSRRALTSMSRQLRTALQFDDNNCTEDKVTFWSDIDNDQDLPGSTATYPTDIYHFTQAEKVAFSKSGSTVIATVTQPASEGSGVMTAKLGSYVTNLKFFYFAENVIPGGSDPADPDENFDPLLESVNDEAAMIRIVLKLEKGKVHHTYYEDVFLRIVKRET